MTRRILFASASALALLLAGGQAARAAESQSAIFNLTGDVANTCTLGDFTAPSSSNATISPGPGPYTVTITLDSAGDDAIFDGFNITVQADAMCNYDTVDIKLTSANGGLDTSGAATAGTFRTEVEYTATVDWVTSTDLVTLLAQGNGPVSNKTENIGDHNGTLSLTIANNTGGGDPLLAGTYSDTLTLDLGPTL